MNLIIALIRKQITVADSLLETNLSLKSEFSPTKLRFTCFFEGLTEEEFASYTPVSTI